jgi:hypothetical protein
MMDYPYYLYLFSSCSVFSPAFLSAFTSRDNDKGRLFDDPHLPLRGRQADGGSAVRGVSRFVWLFCILPAFLSAFTSRDNDKGRLSEQAFRDSGRRCELRPTRYCGLFYQAKSRGEPLSLLPFFLVSQKESKLLKGVP